MLQINKNSLIKFVKVMKDINALLINKNRL